jgi:hypothetical protein
LWVCRVLSTQQCLSSMGPKMMEMKADLEMRLEMEPGEKKPEPEEEMTPKPPEEIKSPNEPRLPETKPMLEREGPERMTRIGLMLSTRRGLSTRMGVRMGLSTTRMGFWMRMMSTRIGVRIGLSSTTRMKPEMVADVEPPEPSGLSSLV